MKLLIRLMLLILICTAAPVSVCAAPGDRKDERALVAVTHELCHRQVAMLGESATHGDGRAEAFKVALVERLIDQCGYDSVFFEASHPEFINIARRLRTGQVVTADQVAAAIGGLWKFDQEFQPLVPFLLGKAQAGKISLGGIDDQLGQLGQDFANVELVAELTGLLPQPQRTDCSAAHHRRIYSDYTEAAPYSKSDRSQIAVCLSDIQYVTAIDRKTAVRDREDRLEMISATQRWISRDFTSDAELIVGRDRSMFQNFEWLRSQRPRRHKVILWAATVHIAKYGDPTWGDHTGANFGSYVHQKYGDHAFSLGFSALAGSYRQGRRNVQKIPTPPNDSMEAQSTREGRSEAVYVGLAQLAGMGIVPGAVFRHSYQELLWAGFLDGVVVLPEEEPPHSSR
ncbi:erythromycin esterase family protein [soil metagenome]